MLPSGRSRESFSMGYGRRLVSKAHPREILDLGSRNAQEAHGHENTSNCDLIISKLDAVEVLDAQTVGRNQAVESQDLIHLDRGNQSATTLSDNGRDCTAGNKYHPSGCKLGY